MICSLVASSEKSDPERHLLYWTVKANSRCRRLTQKQKLSHFAHQKHHLPAPISSRTLKSVIFNWVNQLAGSTLFSSLDTPMLQLCRYKQQLR
ncbi:uncharacterized protein PHALS_07173 [Plasmopara halstedii]|uniref:Uncharacterized protein n=1 Tax=Plasmopara halstedii TaxID=4781 RepID=A0A0P1B3U0_PLAHL|nr:uncharacterized protein PHALS_07173 [Plasmopara halstedii]CEG49409.1 hypothetical protein PHALS_07173 [Plasmopara halstedii]|eukprot:XP_024585778.1 hypothetical protein PHALS_07173 [Plasmopara halstedii]